MKVSASHNPNLYQLCQSADCDGQEGVSQQEIKDLLVKLNNESKTKDFKQIIGEHMTKLPLVKRVKLEAIIRRIGELTSEDNSSNNVSIDKLVDANGNLKFDLTFREKAQLAIQIF